MGPGEGMAGILRLQVGAVLLPHWTRGSHMSSRKPRVSAVVDEELLSWLRARARKERMSVSLVVREILNRVREEDEERHWARKGESRLAHFKRSKALKHCDAWK